MIKELYFKKTNSLNPNIEPLKITFGQGVNVIIGPKGGGKSTLFDLVASLQKGFMPKTVKDALKSFDLEFIKATTFSNEEILANNIAIKSKKDKEQDFLQRNDVIYQDDPIKKNINNLKEIDEQKHSYLKELLNGSNEIKQFLTELSTLHINIQKICKLNQDSSINWTNTFKFTKSTDKIALITRLNYDNSEFIIKAKQEIEKLEEILNNARQQIVNNTRYLDYSFKNFLNDDLFNTKTNSLFKQIIEHYNEVINEITKRIILIKKCIIISNAFNNSYKKIINKVKQEDFVNNGLKIYETQAIDYFKKSAREIFATRKIFQKLLVSEVQLKIKSDPINHEFLAYHLPCDTLISDDKIDEILISFLYVPSKSKNSITKWILENMNRNKQFNQEIVINKIASVLKDQVKVLANGMNYETMSLGQKSIYGIQYKFRQSHNQNLFLDQPEDNLDNYTIASNILDLIEERKKQQCQIFIVTHNANIGILSDPDNVIVADLNNDNEQYSIGTIIQDKTKESDGAHYLEGGLSYIENRLRKIKGN
ncbi:MAG: hypothetical protein ACRC4L_03350 [Mycoplasma sp.]